MATTPNDQPPPADIRAGWQRTQLELVADYHIFRLYQLGAISPRTGEERRYVLLDCPHWVNVIAMTDDKRVILVHQYRHGIDQAILELPSGTVESGEEPLLTAQRELAEETGYTGGTWTALGQVRPNPAYQNNWCYHFLAEGVQLTVEPDLDPGEAIQVELYSWEQLQDLVSSGALDQALTCSALFALSRHQQRSHQQSLD